MRDQKRVKYWRKINGDPKKSIDFVNWIELIKFKETRNYVQRVLENANVYRYMLSGKPVDLIITYDNCGGEGDSNPVDCYTYGNLANFWFKPLTTSPKFVFIYHVQKIKKTFSVR